MSRDSRKIAAILAADVVDYSRLMGADEAGTLAALAIRRKLFDTLVQDFDGRVFGSVGDSLMAEFPSAVHAVECALAIQIAIASENAAHPAERRMRLRIGVNLGDVIESGGATAGDAVNVAARLQALAKPGGVLISGTVYDQVHLKMPVRFVDTGSRHVKNILEPVRTYEVLAAPPAGLGGRIAALISHIASRRVVRAAVIGAALAVAVSLGLFWREVPVSFTGDRLGTLLDPSSSEPLPNSIAVLPFLNMSGDSRDDYLGDGLAEELSHRLAKIPGLHVAARTSTLAIRGKDLGVDEIADRLGVGYVVEGSVKRQADRVRVNAALVEAATGTSRWSNSYEAQSGDFFTIESDIGNQVVIALELVLGTDSKAAAAPHPQGSVAAYDYFLQGLSYLRQPKSAKTLEAAEQLFGRALADQPDFARAQAGLCETHVERYALERVPALVAAAEEACARARALDSTAQEVHMATGKLRLATGDASEAETAYRQALAIVQKSPDVLIGLADALVSGGKTDEAENTYQQAIKVQPRYAAAHIAYGKFLATHGRHAAAIPVFERATLLAPDNPNAFNNLGGAYLHLGDFDKSAKAFARSLAIEPRRASYSNTGAVEYYRGRHREAAQMFRKAIALAPADHRLWGNLADALLFGSQAAEAQKTYRRAFELAEGELAINPKHAVNQAQAAYYASRLGDGDRARRSIAVALAEGDDDYYVHYYVALAELGLGDRDDALAHVRRAKELGYPDELLKAAPELGEIRKMF
jgi:adenylate cyclase